MAKANLLQGYGGREDEECRLREGNEWLVGCAVFHAETKESIIQQ